MDLIPVLDLKAGRVVRGIAGQREHYRDNVSRLVADADPLDTLHALQEAFEPALFYVADLDGIEDRQPQFDLLRELAACCPLAVDAGTITVPAAKSLIDTGVKQVIVSLESLESMDQLAEIVRGIGAERVIFSLDLRDGRPIGAVGRGRRPLQLVLDAERLGVFHVLVLDLAQIGMGRGVSTNSLCRSIKSQRPELRLWTGGGVRSIADLHRLAVSLLDGVLVASALHDGRITPDDWATFRSLENDDLQLATEA